MAGGVSTPELVAAVGAAGGMGFLPAGYLSPERLRDGIHRVRELGGEPFGVNVFVPGPDDADASAIEGYARTLRPEAERLGASLGAARYDDDAYAEKVDVLLELRPAAASFTFGCPEPSTAAALHAAGIEVWVTVTDPAEAGIAEEAGADALIVQGAEAGGHRGSFRDLDGAPATPLVDAIEQIAARTGVPLVGAGGVADRAGVAAVLAAGASAVQVGTALMLAPEAGTAPVHRAAFRSDAGTHATRAFTGRTARGIRNRFMRDHDADAPAGYPQVHHLTAPLRAAAKAQGDASAMHLWASVNYRLAREAPAARIIADLAG